MIFVFIFLLLIFSFHTFKAKWNPTRSDFFPLNQIIIIGHRGAPVLAPENTIDSFIKAFETCMNGIELDVQLSQDGELVVYHNWDLKNITGSLEQIEDLDYVEIRDHSLHNNCQIPLLVDVLKICPKNKYINIEIKSRNYLNTQIVTQVVKIIRQYKIEKYVVISSFNPFVLWVVKKFAPDLSRAYLWSSENPSFLFNSPLWIWICQPDGFYIDINNADEKIINWAKKKNLVVLAFTINNASDLAKAQRLGLDGIFTDNPYLQINSS